MTLSFPRKVGQIWVGAGQIWVHTPGLLPSSKRSLCKFLSPSVFRFLQLYQVRITEPTSQGGCTLLCPSDPLEGKGKREGRRVHFPGGSLI